MARLLMTLSVAEGHFCSVKFCNIHNSGNIVCFNSVCLHTIWKVHSACLALGL